MKKLSLILLCLFAFTAGTVFSQVEKVGRWMSPIEYQKMENTGMVQIGSGGVTYGATNPGYFRKQASPGSIYVEFYVPEANVIAFSDGKLVMVSDDANAVMLARIKKQGGQLLPFRYSNLSGIIEQK